MSRIEGSRPLLTPESGSATEAPHFRARPTSEAAIRAVPPRARSKRARPHRARPPETVDPKAVDPANGQRTATERVPTRHGEVAFATHRRTVAESRIRFKVLMILVSLAIDRFRAKNIIHDEGGVKGPVVCGGGGTNLKVARQERLRVRDRDLLFT